MFVNSVTSEAGPTRAKTESNIYEDDTGEIWALSQSWCYNNGLAAFWKYANSRGAVFKCMRLFYGDRVQITQMLASLQFGDVVVFLRRAPDSEFVSLWINYVKVLTYIDGDMERSEKSDSTAGRVGPPSVVSNRAEPDFGTALTDWNIIMPVFMCASGIALGALLAHLAFEAGYDHQDYELPMIAFEG
jgi:hypothetical protein